MTGIPLTELSRAARELAPRDFAARHGSAFLVHHGPLAAAPPNVDGKTVGGAATVAGTRRTKASDFLVFPLRSSGRTAFAGYVWVGRAANNDVIIPDGTISETHAFFVERAGGWCVHDAGSRNGTFVDKDPVPEQKAGPPTVIISGSRVRLGQVNLIFLVHPELMQLARRLL